MGYLIIRHTEHSCHSMEKNKLSLNVGASNSQRTHHSKHTKLDIVCILTRLAAYSS